LRIKIGPIKVLGVQVLSNEFRKGRCSYKCLW
jgi:hypothetical protein